MALGRSLRGVSISRKVGGLSQWQWSLVFDLRKTGVWENGLKSLVGARFGLFHGYLLDSAMPATPEKRDLRCQNDGQIFANSVDGN